jgi:TolB protein
MDVDGSNVRRISFEGDYNEGACWRPDGSHLVYASRGAGFRFQIAETNLVDLRTSRLTDGADSYEQPCYSPDGRRIVFTVKRGPESQIHVMKADGSDWRQLTHEGNNMAPDWSNFVDK